MGDLQRLIAFDLDGTLIDSRRDLTDSTNVLLQELGAPPLGEDAVARMVGDGAARLVARALQASGLGGIDPLSALPRFLAVYDAHLLRHTHAYEGIAEAVRHARSVARTVVLTNKPIGPSERILHGLGMRELFDDVIGGDGPWAKKPDPAGLRSWMTRWNVPADRTLLVGDSAIDLETARRAGVHACLAAYGFSGHTVVDAVPDDVWVAAAPSDLQGIVDAFSAGELPAPGASTPRASRS